MIETGQINEKLPAIEEMARRGVRLESSLQIIGATEGLGINTSRWKFGLHTLTNSIRNEQVSVYLGNASTFV